MRLAVLFSGQGHQQSEHLARLRQNLHTGTQAVLAQVIPQVWNQTSPSSSDILANRNAQPLIFALQMHLWEQLAKDLPKPACVAGYSLGEMAACSAAGLFSIEEGILLCAARAEAMDNCVSEPAGLLAIKGLTEVSVRSIASESGVVLAIRNSPDHFILGGNASALESAEAIALRLGANRAVRLGITTPSHTPFLQPASIQFAACLKEFSHGQLAFPVMSAIDGHSLRHGGQATDALARQISSPLNWDACLDAVLEMQPDLLLEIGPGNALCRMWEERNTHIPIRASDDFRSVEGILNWIKTCV